MPGCQAVKQNGTHCRNYSCKNKTCCYQHRYLENIVAEVEVKKIKPEKVKELFFPLRVRTYLTTGWPTIVEARSEIIFYDLSTQYRFLNYIKERLTNYDLPLFERRMVALVSGEWHMQYPAQIFHSQLFSNVIEKLSNDYIDKEYIKSLNKLFKKTFP